MDLTRAPGPAPWSLRGNHSSSPEFVWREVDLRGPAAGCSALERTGVGTVLLVGMYNYVMTLDADTLVMWHQKHVASGPTAPVTLRAIVLSQLRPLGGDPTEIATRMAKDGDTLMISGPLAAEVTLPTTTIDQPLSFDFPDPISQLDEILMLCHSSGVEESPGYERSNLALLVAEPQMKRYQLYPQDWFNHAGLDYGYQWVTRVARDPRTGRIHGDGVRIAPFVLSDSMRQKR